MPKCSKLILLFLELLYIQLARSLIISIIALVPQVCFCDEHVKRKGFKYERNQPIPCPKCGFDTQPTKDLSMSTRTHSYGRKTLENYDDYNQYGGYSAGAGYGEYDEDKTWNGEGEEEEEEDSSSEDDEEDDEDESEEEDDESEAEEKQQQKGDGGEK